MGHGRLAFIALFLLCGCNAPPPGSTQSTAKLSDSGTAASMRDQAPPSGAIAALASLSPEDLARPSAKRDEFVRRYLADSCEPEERLAFDTVCQHYGAARTTDPSPWPELIAAIHDGRLASVVLTDQNARLDGWACEALAVPGTLRACFAPGVSHEDRVLWMQQWNAFLSAAD